VGPREGNLVWLRGGDASHWLRGGDASHGSEVSPTHEFERALSDLRVCRAALIHEPENEELHDDFADKLAHVARLSGELGLNAHMRKDARHQVLETARWLESMPIASLGRIKVVSIDYRQGPKYHHPAASEDVAAVYRELLKAYRPENVGIYGCSAGGMLTGMSVAWFQRHDLPRPGAIGILCAGAAGGVGAAFGGDANFTTMPLGEGRVAPAASSSQAPMGYFAGTDPNDPLVAPASSPEVLAKFPPTLIVTATRGFELSNAVYTHTQLVKQGVDADLHVWEGMFHGFFYNPDVPESRDCYDVIIRFFANRLGKR